MHESIPVLDFGSQTAQLIVRRLRELGVYSELVPHDAPKEDVLALQPRGIVLSGGPASVYEPGAPQLPSWLCESDLPVLGICYGMQLQAHALGGRVEGMQSREFGPVEITVVDPGLLFADTPAHQQVWMSHGDHIAALPAGFRVMAHSPGAPFAAAGDDQRRWYGIQFHPEVVDTRFGRDMLRNFAFRICGCRGDWQPASFVAEAIARVRDQVGDGRVICALSAGSTRR